jgi:hypothetical protein
MGTGPGGVEGAVGNQERLTGSIPRLLGMNDQDVAPAAVLGCPSAGDPGQEAGAGLDPVWRADCGRGDRTGTSEA